MIFTISSYPDLSSKLNFAGFLHFFNMIRQFALFWTL